jgi:iron complex outermembrane receptor protein
VSVVDVDEVASGFSASVILPSYTLVNAGISYQTEDWSVNVTVKNLTDERYFRSNFPDLFGSQIILPELPRHWNAKFAYRF